jgi:hypothetical protein
MTTLLRSLRLAAATVFVAAAPIAAQRGHPMSARLVTEDIPRFWAAFDARATLGTARAIDSLYFKPGTPGLQDWIRLRLTNAKTLAATVDKVPGYDESARASTLQIARDEPKIRAAFVKLLQLYPDADFPDVYFVIGRLSSGGTLSDRNLLIGAEMYGRTTEEAMAGLSAWHHQVLATVDKVPAITSHELVHFQQTRNGFSLLAQALREGGADFVAELMTNDNINAHVHAWVRAEPGRERQIWEEFQADMAANVNTRWFQSDDVAKRPKDLGYYVGYKITQAYWESHADKQAAMKEILRFTDPVKFLKQSGYNPR